MNVSLTNELENFIDGMVASGMYYSASEVVRDGLRLLKDKEELKAAKLTELRAEVLKGYEQAKRGESRPLDVEAIKAEGRRRLAAVKHQK
ncbi:MAG: type II toxin-antitoxin system ParD family antitoxin [Pyrinomonadaceae bacterium]